ncbi:MAG: phosphatidate cytidylyltransferase [Phycisphaerae bacterium]|nr:phosphatidate cytidylyltransferase [Phycisphaerae bacterium]
MAGAFIGLAILDGWLDGALTVSQENDRAMQGAILCLLIMVLQIPMHLELAGLVQAKGLKIPVWVTIIGSSVLVTIPFFQHWLGWSCQWLPGFVLVLCFLAMFAVHAVRFGIDGVIHACGAGSLAIVYLGWLSCFAMALRVEYGLWPVVMFVLVVKFSDIGAYTVGRLIGKHKFSPRISPGKTWEGLAGACIFAVILSVVFADCTGIMTRSAAVVFGGCFAFIGQMGDLVESMLKRDAVQKDSSSHVPGFGGLLDVLDSLLIAAPFAYMFFALCC